MFVVSQLQNLPRLTTASTLTTGRTTAPAPRRREYGLQHEVYLLAVARARRTSASAPVAPDGDERGEKRRLGRLGSRNPEGTEERDACCHCFSSRISTGSAAHATRLPAGGQVERPHAPQRAYQGDAGGSILEHKQHTSTDSALRRSSL
jgi:hypothetical protein